MKPLSRLSTIIENYDALLLDLWGVVHDGSHLYPGVYEAFTELKKANKKIILVSNAPRRAQKAATLLSQLGIPAEMYDHVITSGELGYQWLAAGRAPWGKRFYYIDQEANAVVLEGLDLTRVRDLKEADFLACIGFNPTVQPMPEMEKLLIAAHNLNVPMLCLNPDLEVVKITGEREPCAGVLGKVYEALGGKVTWFGKPYAAVYEYCLEKLNPLPKSRILAIGDGIGTDILGATQFGMDAVLVTGGIIKNESPDAVEAMCRKHGAVPQYMMHELTW